MHYRTNPMMNVFWRSPAKTILISGITAGTLDISGAILVYSVIMHKITAARILQGIASGVFGKGAFSGGAAMEVYGLIFHYFIAFSFAVTYFLAFPYIPFLQRQKVVSGIFYGVFIWFVMNVIVLPLVFTNRPPMTLTSAVIAASILIVMIGLPVSFITNKYYSENR